MTNLKQLIYLPWPSTSHMLIDEYRVAVGVNGNEAGRACCALVCFLLQLHPLRLQLTLQLADICEGVDLLGVAVPAGIEGEYVLLEHPLKQPDGGISVF